MGRYDGAAAFGVRRQTLRSLGAAGAPSPLIEDHVATNEGRRYLGKSALRLSPPGIDNPVTKLN